MIEGTEGGCDCGKVRYRLKAEPIVVNCCHCKACQRQTGSGFAINILIEADNVDVLGEAPEAYRHKTTSGQGQSNFRCAHCGTSVWSIYHAAGDGLRFVRAGSLDDPAAVAPDAHIFVVEKLPWIPIPDDAEQFPGFFPGKDIVRVFGEDGAARWKAAIGS